MRLITMAYNFITLFSPLSSNDLWSLGYGNDDGKKREGKRVSGGSNANDGHQRSLCLQMSHCRARIGRSMRDEPSVDFRLKIVPRRRAPSDLLRHHVDGHVISDVMPGVTTNRRWPSERALAQPQLAGHSGSLV